MIIFPLSSVLFLLAQSNNQAKTMMWSFFSAHNHLKESNNIVVFFERRKKKEVRQWIEICRSINSSTVKAPINLIAVSNLILRLWNLHFWEKLFYMSRFSSSCGVKLFPCRWTYVAISYLFWAFSVQALFSSLIQNATHLYLLAFILFFSFIYFKLFV